MKILVLGGNGMLGHIVKLYLEEKGHEVLATTRDKKNSNYFDASLNINGIEKILNDYKPHVVINCIGILNKDAEENKSNAVIINSYLPHYLDELSKKYDFKFIHISTDCVFEGTKGEYVETSLRDATSFYGRSKALGEIENDKNVTLRTSIVGPDMNENGIGLFNWFMKQSGEINGYTKAIWTGVTTLELAKVIENLLSSNITGIYHIVNNVKITKYELLLLFNEIFEREILVKKEENYDCDKSLLNTRIDFDFSIPSYKDMIKEMKEWIYSHLEIYPKYYKKEK